MNLMKCLDKYVKKMTVFDVSLVKLTVFFMTLFLITVWSGFRTLVLRISWYWYLIISVLLMIPIFKKMFK